MRAVTPLRHDELERLAAEARAEAEAANRFPRWAVVAFWSLIGFEIGVIVWGLLP